MRRIPLVALALVLAFVGLACSLTNLDGFTGGSPARPDGGSRDASTKPGSGLDGGGDAKAPANDGGPTSEGGPTITDPYADSVRADAPTSWWRFEDAIGSQTLHDEMNQHHAQLLAVDSHPITVQWGVAGAVGKAAQLGNTAGYFDVGDVFDFTGLVPFTLEAWVKNETPADEYEGIFNKRADSPTTGEADTGWVVFIHKPDRELGFQFWKNTSVTASNSSTLPVNGFHHVVITATQHADGIDYQTFLDGAATASDAQQTTQELDTAANLLLGYGWNGALDEMAIYEHALTPERVLAHYRAARP